MILLVAIHTKMFFNMTQIDASNDNDQLVCNLVSKYVIQAVYFGSLVL